jgi:3-oxoacyl-[acyl-carrier-protein] synthase II
MKHQVVVTGLGSIASNGNSPEDFFTNLIAGKNGYIESDKHLSPDFPFRVCGKIPAFDLSKYLSEEEINTLDRSAQLGIIAASMAVEDSKLQSSSINPKRIAVVMGTTCGANLAIEENNFQNNWFENKDELDIGNFQRYNHADISNAISKKFGFRGSSYLEATACASGNHSIGEAYDLIQLGHADVVICGGAEAISLLPMLGFNASHALSQTLCSPFDKDRKGVIIGEGSGVLVLESAEHAQAREANIYAELKGWSLNCDADNITMPIVDGSRCEQLINSCLQNATIDSSTIDYISLHGTGTNFNDKTEVAGIKRAFGENYNKPLVSSIKSMIGHSFGAAGALEGVMSVLALNKNMVPPNTNLNEPEEGFDLNFVNNENYQKNIDSVLSLSFGFGGCNVATCFTNYKAN